MGCPNVFQARDGERFEVEFGSVWQQTERW